MIVVKLKILNDIRTSITVMISFLPRLNIAAIEPSNHDGVSELVRKRRA